MQTAAHFLYVISQNQGVIRFDLADVHNIRPAGSFFAYLQPTDLEVTESYLFLASRARDGLTAETNAGDVQAAAQNKNGITVLSVSDPEKIEQVNFIPLDPLVYSLEKLAERLYVLTGSGLTVLDATDPVNPQNVTSLAIPGIAFTPNLLVSGQRLFISTGPLLAMLDLNDPLRPTLRNFFHYPEYIQINDIEVRDNDLFLALAAGLNGIHTLALGTNGAINVPGLGPANPPEILELLRFGNDLVSVNSNGWSQLDLTDPNPLAFQDTWHAPLTITCAFGQNTRLHLFGQSSGLADLVYDLTTPAEPVTSGFSTITSPLSDQLCLKAVSDNPDRTVLITPKGIISLQFGGEESAAPGSISRTQTFSRGAGLQTAGPLTSGAAVQDWIYLSDSSYVYFYFQYPEILSLIAIHKIAELEHIIDFVYHDSTLYFLDQEQGLVIYKVIDPYNLQELARLALPLTTGTMQLVGYHLLISAGEAGCYLVNVFDRQAPMLVGTVDTPGLAAAAVSYEGTLYLADHYDLSIIQLHP
jgi:hypothetical protein